MMTEKAKEIVRNLGDNSYSDDEKAEAISEISRGDYSGLSEKDLISAIRFLLTEPKWHPYMRAKNGGIVLCRPAHSKRVLVTDGRDMWLARFVIFKPTKELLNRAESDGNVYGWDTGKEILDPYKTMWMELPRL